MLWSINSYPILLPGRWKLNLARCPWQDVVDDSLWVTISWMTSSSVFISNQYKTKRLRSKGNSSLRVWMRYFLYEAEKYTSDFVVNTGAWDGQMLFVTKQQWMCAIMTNTTRWQNCVTSADDPIALAYKIWFLFVLGSFCVTGGKTLISIETTEQSSRAKALWQTKKTTIF